MQARTRVSGVVRRLVPGLITASALAVMAAACSSGGGTGSGTAGSSATTAPAPAAASSSAASGGGSGSTAAAGAPDPCQVVTVAEASQLTGQTLTQTGDKQVTAYERICTYSAAGVAVIVTVAALPSYTPAQAKSFYNEAVAKLSSAPGIKFSNPGLGDKSLAGTLDLGGFHDTAIAVLKGQVYLSIQTTSKASVAAVKALAVTALGRV